MLGFLLFLLATSAATLVVPAALALQRLRVSAHRGQPAPSVRRVRLVVAAVLVGCGALGISALLGAEWLVAAAAALLLGVAVLAGSPLAESWAVRGVTTWVLLVVAVSATLAWVLYRLVTSTASGADLAAGVLGWLLVVGGLLVVRRPVRSRIALRSGAGPDEPTVAGRPAFAVAGLVAASGVVLATTSGGVSLPGGGSASSAGAADPARRPTSPSTTPTPSGTRSPEPTPTREPQRRATRDAGPGRDARNARVDTPTRQRRGGEPEPTPEPAEQPTKTPGYAKDKENRPPDAPDPGPDRPRDR